MTINGPGADNLAVNGNATFRVFENFEKDVTISGFTITNGLGGLGIGGGGILNHGGLTLNNSIVSNCFIRDASGGGIENDGTLTVTNSVISGNGGCCTFNLGGGIANSGNLTVTNSTISDNSTSNDGGGIASEGNLTVMNSTISGNSVPLEGGGMFLDGGTTTVTNSTISDNAADNSGGGIATGGQVTVTNSTISGNSSSGGSIFIIAEQTTIGDTILKAGELGGTIVDDGGTVTSLGYNPASDDGGGFLIGPGDQINTDPMLGPLQDNGGPTFTHELLPGSPAIDAGDLNFTTA